MSLLILLLKEKKSIVTQIVNTNIKEYINDLKLKYGAVDLKHSVLIDGDESVLERLNNSIEIDYYTSTGLISDEWFSEIVNDIERKNKRMNLNLDIYDSINIKEDVNISNNPIETFSLDNEKYIFYCLVTNDGLLIGNNTSFDITDFDSFKPINKHKSFTVEFENFDEISSMFEGMKNDTMEIYEECTEGITIDTAWSETVLTLIETKISLSKWRNFINYLSLTKNTISTKIDDTYEYDMMTSKEVCKLLRISDQTLANWRRSGIIEFKKISSRKFIFPRTQILDIQENGICTDGIVKQTKSPMKINIENIVKVEKTINYNDKIKEWVTTFTHGIPAKKYNNQNFFLNFGNVGFISSPHVMITNDLKLVDYIKKDILIDNEKELYAYLEDLNDKDLKPKIDTSKRVYQGFDLLYLNKLFEPIIR